MLRKRLEKLEMLLEVNRELAQELDLDRLLRLVVARVTQVMDADRSSLYVLDQEKGEIWTRVAEGVEEIRLPLGRGIAGHVAQTGRVVKVEDAYREPQFDRSWDLKHSYHTRTVLCVPLRGRHGEAIGVFEVLNKRDGVFNREDEELLLALGAGVAGALENALLMEELRQANRKLSEAYDRLLQSEKLSMLGLLSSTLAHDIRNPLGLILNQAEVLRRKMPDEPIVKQPAEVILKQGERILELVESVQNFSRKGSETFGEVHVHRVLREALVLTSHLLARRQIEVEQDLAADLPPVIGSANRLEQVFMNLIQNALQAMPEGGRLSVATRYVSDLQQVEVRVSDTGGGIPASEEGRIFDAFYTTKTEGQGTGLGLSICQRIVEEHRGEIELVNRPGEGATFVVRLPGASRQ